MVEEEHAVKKKHAGQSAEHMAAIRAMIDPSKRRNPSARTKKKFFMGDKLYGRLYVDQTKNIVIAWCSTDQKRVVINYHDMLNHSERPYGTRQVAKLLNRSVTQIRTLMRRGDIRKPETWCGPDDTSRPANFRDFMWRKEDILDAHTVLLTKGTGRPNKYGEHRAYPMVSRPELLALLRNDITMYIKDSEGNMLPTWKAII